MEEAALGLPTLLAAVNTEGDPQVKLLKDQVGGIGLWFLDSPVYRVFFLPDDLASYRRYVQAAQGLAARPYAEAREAWKKSPFVGIPKDTGLLTDLLLPDASKCAEATAQADAWHRVAQLALAVEDYRVQTGRFPNRLEELTPALLPGIPIDPFTGKPLRFRKDEQDFLVYSVGLDGKNDDGTPWNSQKKEGDLVFRLRGR